MHHWPRGPNLRDEDCLRSYNLSKAISGICDAADRAEEAIAPETIFIPNILIATQRGIVAVDDDATEEGSMGTVFNEPNFPGRYKMIHIAILH